MSKPIFLSRWQARNFIKRNSYLHQRVVWAEIKRETRKGKPLHARGPMGESACRSFPLWQSKHFVAPSHGSRARIVFISDSSAGRIDSAGLPSGASSERTSVWLPDFVTKTATLPWYSLAGFG